MGKASKPVRLEKTLFARRRRLCIACVSAVPVWVLSSLVTWPQHVRPDLFSCASICQAPYFHFSLWRLSSLVQVRSSIYTMGGLVEGKSKHGALSQRSSSRLIPRVFFFRENTRQLWYHGFNNYMRYGSFLTRTFYLLLTIIQRSLWTRYFYTNRQYMHAMMTPA